MSAVLKLQSRIWIWRNWDHLLWRIKNDLITKQNCQKQTTNRRITVTLAYVIFTAYEGNRRIFCLDWVFLLNFTGCTEKVSEACTHKSFEIIQTVDINQSNSSLIPAMTKRQNNWIESCAAYAEFCRSHILPMMNQNKLCHHKGISDREKINLNRINITRSYEAKSRSASAEFRRGLQGKLRLGVLAEETRCNATLRPRLPWLTIRWS